MRLVMIKIVDEALIVHPTVTATRPPFQNVPKKILSTENHDRIDVCLVPEGGNDQPKYVAMLEPQGPSHELGTPVSGRSKPKYVAPEI